MVGITRASFATTSTEEALPVLAPMFPDLTLAGSATAGFHFDIETAGAGALSTTRYRLVSPGSTATTDGTGTLTVVHVLGGGIQFMNRGREADRRQPLLMPAWSISAAWDDVTVGATNIDLPEVEHLAQQLAGSDSFALAFTDLHPVNRALSRFWTATIRTLNRDLLRDDQAMASPLVRAAAAQQIAHAVLNVFPNTLMDLREPRDGAKAVPAAIRRSTEYIDAHLGGEVTVADVAEAAHLSIRGITEAFRRELDTTPMNYLRAGRLAAAHRDLLDSDASTGVTVASIAHRWGFNNMGRFAAAYRQQFGTSPATTLRG